MLTESDIQSYKTRLLDKKQSVQDQLNTSAESSQSVELDQQRVGRLSRMDAMQQQQMALALRRRLETDLVRINAALGRIEVGAYGVCAKCEQPIARERLDAVPELPLCVACQPQGKRQSP